MRILRVSDIPHGGIAYVNWETGREPDVWVDADFVDDDQADKLLQRLIADPDVLKALCGTAV